MRELAKLDEVLTISQIQILYAKDTRWSCWKLGNPNIMHQTTFSLI